MLPGPDRSIDPDVAPPEVALQVTYVGHATTLLEIDGVRILTDPALRNRVAQLRRLTRLEPPAEALARVDAVLVSHLHFDHFDLGTLRRLDRAVRLVVPVGGAVRLLRRRGFTDVEGVEEGSVLELGSVRVRAVAARHSGRRGTSWLSGPALGYVVEGSDSIYFAGDTDVHPGMADLGAPGVALLPVAGWGPRLPEGGHMNPLRAALALTLLRPRLAIPIHWGTFAPLWNPRGYPANAAAGVEFRRLAGEVAPEVDVRVLEPGQRLAVPPGPGSVK